MSAQRQPADLALFKGAPTFAEPLHVGRPNIGDRARLLRRFEDILDRRWFTNGGPMVEEFERELAARLGVRHAIAICNGTVALELAIRGLGLRGEVILPAFTFVATAHALQWQEITPVFCDVDPVTHALDPRRVEALITPRTTGIIGVHLWGRPCAVEELEDLARRRGLKLMFDAAHAFGCRHGGRPIGGFGAAEVFSFHATKFFNTFEGGAISTNDDELAGRLRFMKNFGFAGYDRVVALGVNGKMTEVCAAMGLTGLESLDQFIAVNERNHGLYREAFAGLPGMQAFDPGPHGSSNFQYVIHEVDAESAGLTRDELVRVLWAEGVRARRYFHPGCHRMEPYRSRPEGLRAPLPETERLCERVVALPTGTAVGAEEIARIGELVRFALAHGPEIRRLMAAGAAGG